jgi:hypothetical protein
MSETPASRGKSDAPKKEEKEKSPWWLPIVVVIGAAPAVLVIGIFVWILRTGFAHDESRCPFHDVETRELDPHARVLEQARRCIEQVEEHRWMLVRDALPPRELGRMPLEQERIGEGFPWQARLEDGRVVVDVTNEPRGVFTLREPFPDGGTGGPNFGMEDEESER